MMFKRRFGHIVLATVLRLPSFEGATWTITRLVHAPILKSDELGVSVPTSKLTLS